MQTTFFKLVNFYLKECLKFTSVKFCSVTYLNIVSQYFKNYVTSQIFHKQVKLKHIDMANEASFNIFDWYSKWLIVKMFFAYLFNFLGDFSVTSMFIYFRYRRNSLRWISVRCWISREMKMNSMYVHDVFQIKSISIHAFKLNKLFFLICCLVSV